MVNCFLKITEKFSFCLLCYMALNTECYSLSLLDRVSNLYSLSRLKSIRLEHRILSSRTRTFASQWRIAGGYCLTRREAVFFPFACVLIPRSIYFIMKSSLSRFRFLLNSEEMWTLWNWCGRVLCYRFQKGRSPFQFECVVFVSRIMKNASLIVIMIEWWLRVKFDFVGVLWKSFYFRIFW